MGKVKEIATTLGAREQLQELRTRYDKGSHAVDVIDSILRYVEESKPIPADLQQQLFSLLAQEYNQNRYGK